MIGDRGVIDPFDTHRPTHLNLVPFLLRVLLLLLPLLFMGLIESVYFLVVHDLSCRQQ